MTAPQDSVNYELTQPQQVIDNAGSFANFMRFLAPPAPVSSYGSVTSAANRSREGSVRQGGLPVLPQTVHDHGQPPERSTQQKTVDLFSDLLVHDIGTGDDISQGLAEGSQFRTAPLWGCGQRLFFLHDGSAATSWTRLTRMQTRRRK